GNRGRLQQGRGGSSPYLQYFSVLISPQAIPGALGRYVEKRIRSKARHQRANRGQWVRLHFALACQGIQNRNTPKGGGGIAHGCDKPTPTRARCDGAVFLDA